MIFKNFRLSGRVGKIQALLMKEKYVEVNHMVDEMLQLDPPDYLESIALIQKGEAEYYLGSKEQALMCFNKAINLYKKFPKAEPVNKSNSSVGRAVQFIEFINDNKT